jgi:hypothetical protein
MEENQPMEPQDNGEAQETPALSKQPEFPQCWSPRKPDTVAHTGCLEGALLCGCHFCCSTKKLPFTSFPKS